MNSHHSEREFASCLLALLVCKKNKKKLCSDKFNPANCSLAAVAHIFNYNALQLQSPGWIEESMNRVLASGASFIFFFSKRSNKNSFLSVLRCNHSPSSWTCEPLPVCVAAVFSAGWKGLEPRLPSNKRTVGGTESKQGIKRDEEGSGLKMQRWCRALTHFPMLNDIISCI